MSILDRIKRWVNPPSTPRYKIIHDPQFGYKPIYDTGGGYYRWQMIDEYGRTFIDSNHPSSFVPTIEAAGERINLHATNRGQRIVWTEPTT